MFQRLKPYLAMTTTCVLFAFSFLFTKDATRYLTTFQLLGYRFIVATATLTILALTKVVKLNLTIRKVKSMLLLTLLLPVTYYICETNGVRLTTTSETGIIMALGPIVITLFSVLIMGEKLPVFRWISAAVSVLGAVVMVLAQGLQADIGHSLGYLALLGAVVSGGLFNPLSKKISEHSTPIEITFVMMWVGAIVFNCFIGLPMAAMHGTLGSYFNGLLNPRVAIGMVYLGIGCSVVAFFFQNYALSKLKTSVVGTYGNIMPVITVLAGMLINGDRLLPLQCVGAALIFVGIWGSLYRSKEPAREQVTVEPITE